MNLTAACLFAILLISSLWVCGFSANANKIGKSLLRMIKFKKKEELTYSRSERRGTGL